MTSIRVHQVVAPATVLGPGTRVAVWVQGCTIGCQGCASRDTWDADAGRTWDVDDLVREVVDAAGAVGATGLTVTGGEPFQQADETAQLVAEARTAWPGPEAVDVLIFTGYAAKAAQRISPVLWGKADVIVAGPYRRDRTSEHPLLGSANQTIEVLSDLGQERLAATGTGRARLQVSVRDGQLSLLGMPDPGDLDRLEALLADRGIRFDAVSWQPAGDLP